MRTVNVAIIGQGRSGRDIHGAFFKDEISKPQFKVVAVVDAKEDRRNRAAEEFGCDVYADYKELFGRTDIDVVVNSTFSHMHYPITKDLLEHGFNVVCEKPFCAHTTEVEDLIRTAKANNRFVTVFQQSRLAPYYKRIKEIIDSGILGELLQVRITYGGLSRRWDWQTSLRYNGGVLRNTGPHPLDQALDILDIGDEVPTVWSKFHSGNSFGDAENYAKVILTYPGKPLIDIELNPGDAFETDMYHISGTNGSLKANGWKVEYKYFDPKEAPEQKLILEPLIAEDGITPAYCREKLPIVEKVEELTGTAFDAAVQAYYQNIYEVITEGKELFIKPEENLRLVRIFEIAHLQNPGRILY